MDSKIVVLQDVMYRKRKPRGREKTSARGMSGSFDDKFSRHDVMTVARREGRGEKRRKN